MKRLLQNFISESGPDASLVRALVGKWVLVGRPLLCVTNVDQVLRLDLYLGTKPFTAGSSTVPVVPVLGAML